MNPTQTPAPTQLRPRTVAQRDAAQRNGARSKGPVTSEGKDRSRGNALKHGFRGDGTVLPEPMRAELSAEIHTFARVLKPRDEVEPRLVERAALASVRFLWIAHAEHQAVAEGRRAAIARWDADRAAARRRWAEALEPPGPSAESTPRPEPAEAVAALMQTGDGCRWLSARWRALGEILETRGWDGAEALRAARLRGRATAGARPLDGAGPRAFWADVAAARSNGPAGDAARGRLRSWIAARRRALLRRARRLWRTIDGPSRAAAPALAACDTRPEAVRRARYYSDAERMGRLSLAALDARRRAARRDGAGGGCGARIRAGCPGFRRRHPGTRARGFRDSADETPGTRRGVTPPDAGSGPGGAPGHRAAASAGCPRRPAPAGPASGPGADARGRRIPNEQSCRPWRHPDP